jgi:hypothetical protein
MQVSVAERARSCRSHNVGATDGQTRRAEVLALLRAVESTAGFMQGSVCQPLDRRLTPVRCKILPVR